MTRTSKHLSQLERELEEYKAYNAQLREDVARLREILEMIVDSEAERILSDKNRQYSLVFSIARTALQEPDNG